MFTAGPGSLKVVSLYTVSVVNSLRNQVGNRPLCALLKRIIIKTGLPMQRHRATPQSWCSLISGHETGASCLPGYSVPWPGLCPDHPGPPAFCQSRLLLSVCSALTSLGVPWFHGSLCLWSTLLDELNVYEHCGQLWSSLSLLSSRIMAERHDFLEDPSRVVRLCPQLQTFLWVAGGWGFC